ncbi:hypothetical protein [Marinitenerispora sediminis]|uniref:Uncharacterized protein n=1 Tax=Marinitenerispora sediminis TaxID=1931232 RepID=A0A368T8Q3_9ACTN|nr:hypothetical protein [Marinitenerispora sediminis]RCV53541.1 hypothetical protein DEF28_10430 [Marinitenerispora sediminis]RCV57705.1 hypothetical protein DEF23_10315 [Marinitenerispora sediminis]RCV60778.1 hypothetical protein DEF24_06130 [Marinitenerispora sediminis]
MAEFRISSDDGFDLRRLATALAESQGWARDQVGIWDNRDGSVIVTVPDSLLHRPAPDPLQQPVHTRSDVHSACELLRQRDTSLRGVAFTDLRAEAARFFSAGWSTADLLHALSHRPDGQPWPRGEGYQGVEWLEHRLRNWKTPTGDIRPSVSQETAQLRIVGRAGLPEDLGLPADEEPSRRRQVARPEAARAAADDARRLMRVQARTTSNTLAHRDRTASHITRRDS